jgi:iron complex outermembrane receptor protein
LRALSAALLTLAGAVGVGRVAYAESPENGRAQLQEVVVTAERRPENAQTIPTAVTTLSSDELAQGGVIGTTSLSQAAPGLMFMQSANTATPFIRGVGSTITSVGAEGAVSTYVDGVYVASLNAAVFELNNVERVEVVKGPQGTLFGRNATGGVVHIITRAPSFTPSADLQLGYGNYEMSHGSFYGTTGLGEHVAIDFAAYGRNQADGWGADLTTGESAFTRHDLGARSKMLWVPGERTRVTLSVDYNRARNQDGLGFHLISPAVGVDGVSRYHGFYQTYDDPIDSSDIGQTGASLTANHEFSSARLVSITSWRNADGLMLFDQDSTPAHVVRASIHQHDRSATQELQLQSRDDAALPWIVGIYYLHDRAAYDPLATAGTIIAPSDERQVWSAQTSNSYAAFGQVVRGFGADTHLTLGARYTRDEREVSGATLGRTGSVVSQLAQGAQDATWSKLTWRAALDHRFTPDVMGYVSADRGFKSGIYNLLAYTAPPVHPETLDAYQAGLKTELFERRLRLNASAFYYEYEDLQVQQIISGSTVVINAAGAVMKGIDTDIAWVPIDALSIRGGFVLMKGYYTDFPDAPFFSPLVDAAGQPTGGNRQFAGDATGLDTVRTPRRTATLSAAYHRLSSIGGLQLSASFSYNSGFAWDPDNRLRQSSYDLLNVSAGWNAPHGNWGLQLWGSNLSGTRYCVYAAARALLDSCSPGAPRAYGVTFSSHFRP